MTLLTIPEMVEHYKVNGRPRFSQWFLYTQTKQGRIPGSVRIGGKVFIDTDIFEQWIMNVGKVKNP